MSKLVYTIFYFALCKKNISLKTPTTKNCVENIHSIFKKCMQCRYRRLHWKRRTLFKENKKKLMFEIIIVTIMKLCLFNSIES